MSNYAFDRKPYMPTTSSCLVGPRAESISMSCEQWFEVVGYMARPGRVSSFEAEIPKDGRDKVFEKLFPGQVYRPIELGDTPSGLPNKLGAQFRINFANLDNCPAVLNDSIRAGNGGCVGRISFCCRSRPVLWIPFWQASRCCNNPKNCGRQWIFGRV